MRFNPGLGAGFAKGIGSGATAGTTTAKALALPAVGNRAAGVQMVVPITYQGHSETVYFNLVAVQKGRSEAVLLLIGADAALDSQSIATLSDEATAHLQARSVEAAWIRLRRPTPAGAVGYIDMRESTRVKDPKGGGR